LPKRKSTRGKRNQESEAELESSSAPVRPTWTGTITFGLVSIPVNLYSAIRPRQTAMKLVDKEGNPLGRRYHCSKEDKELDQEELIRGYETDDGKMVIISDEEFESVAPEMSGDIDLKSFVPLDQIPPMYFQRPYFLAPSGKSAKAYHLLAETMQRSGRIGIGSFVMRGHEYLVAIVSENGVLRADALRYHDEIRTPETIGLPKRTKAAAKSVNAFEKEIEALEQKKIDVSELEDKDAEALQKFAHEKEKEGEDVIHQTGLEEADAEEGGAQIIDLMDVLRKSLSKNAVVTNAHSGPPISLDERRAQKAAATTSKSAKKKAGTKKTTRKRAKRAS
jgi:DNA end-binding protein Ku